MLPYWNVLSFFTTYASIDGYDPRTWQPAQLADRADIDRWIVSVLQSLVRDVNQEMEAYRLYAVVPRLVNFIDDLTNWYVRRSRERFWKTEDDADKTDAFATLYEVLTTFSKVLAPFMPFSDGNRLSTIGSAGSTKRPPRVFIGVTIRKSRRTRSMRRLSDAWRPLRAVSTLGRRVREDYKLKVRQPLRELTVVHRGRRGSRRRWRCKCFDLERAERQACFGREG